MERAPVAEADAEAQGFGGCGGWGGGPQCWKREAEAEAAPEPVVEGEFTATYQRASANFAVVAKDAVPEADAEAQGFGGCGGWGGGPQCWKREAEAKGE